MTIEIMQFPITNPISLFIRSETSGGTDFTYIQHEGESIRVRTDQLWFWSSEWQARHKDAIADLEEGRYAIYETGEDFLAAMKKAMADNEVRNG